MWTLQKINQFITDGVEENIHLDYKGSGSLSKQDAKKAEISKDVSAFANSDGGTIIYGIAEFNEAEKRHLPEKLDPIDGTQFTKEWLEQVINSSISPRITNVIITPIQIGDPAQNKVIYVVDIPKGMTAHQAKDKRYYRRFNFESQMMEDWEIKDIINRQTKTDIIIQFESMLGKETIDKFLSSTTDIDIDLDIWAINKGNKVAKYVDCFIAGDSESAKNIKKPNVGLSSFETRFSNEVERKISIDDDDFVVNVDRTAILPNTSKKIGTLRINTNFIRKNCKINLQIATEDGSKNKVITGKEIIE